MSNETVVEGKPETEEQRAAKVADFIAAVNGNPNIAITWGDIENDPKLARLHGINGVFQRTIDTYRKLAVALQDVARYESGLVRAKQEIQSCRESLAKLKKSYEKHLGDKQYLGDPTGAWEFPLEVVERYIWTREEDPSEVRF